MTSVAFMPCKLEISCKKPLFSGMCIEIEPWSRYKYTRRWGGPTCLETRRERKGYAKTLSELARCSGCWSSCQRGIGGGSAAQGPGLCATAGAAANYLDGMLHRRQRRRDIWPRLNG